MNTTPLPTTREACDELIAQITKHRDNLPTHPIVGHMYRHKVNNAVYIAAHISDVVLICVRPTGTFNAGGIWSVNGGFGSPGANGFDHLGPAADHLMLKSDAPKMPEVTGEMAERAAKVWYAYDCSPVETMRHVLALYREGKL